MDKVSEDINHILAKWDPIGISENIATDEYKGYIPMILHLLPNRQELMEYLENVLINEMSQKHFTRTSALLRIKKPIFVIHKKR